MSDSQFSKRVVERFLLILAVVVGVAIYLFAPSGIPTLVNVCLSVIAGVLVVFFDHWWTTRGTSGDIKANMPLEAVPPRLSSLPAILLEGESQGDFTDTTIENHAIGIQARDSSKVKSKKLRMKK